MSLPAVCCAKGRWETWVLALKTKDRNAIIKDRELTKEVRPFDVRHCNRSYQVSFIGGCSVPPCVSHSQQLAKRCDW